MMPSRARVGVGWLGVSFKPPMTYISIRFSASSCPYSATRLTKTSHSGQHHTSPALCSSLFDPPPDSGFRGGPTGNRTLALMCWNVSGFFAMSAEYGYRRIEK
jgi:hypothetical protein